MLTLPEYADIYVNALKKTKHQMQLTSYLRDFSFIFMSFETLKFLELPVAIKDEHYNYSFMIRRTPEGEYDPKMVFCFKLLSKKSRAIHIYVNGNYMATWDVPFIEYGTNFKKVKMTWKFPEQMSYDERKVWRGEHVKAIKDLSYKAKPLYYTWKPVVMKLSGMIEN